MGDHVPYDPSCETPDEGGVAPTDASQKPNLEPGPPLVVKGLLAAVRDHDAGALADLVPDRDAKEVARRSLAKW